MLWGTPEGWALECLNAGFLPCLCDAANWPEIRSATHEYLSLICERRAKRNTTERGTKGARALGTAEHIIWGHWGRKKPNAGWRKLGTIGKGNLCCSSTEELKQTGLRSFCSQNPVYLQMNCLGRYLDNEAIFPFLFLNIYLTFLFSELKTVVCLCTLSLLLAILEELRIVFEFGMLGMA